MPKLLELFSGTGSVGKVARELGFEVVSLDRDMEADIKTDIMNWDFSTYSEGDFDVIWASPPCTEYSRAKTIGIRDIAGANEVVKRTLDIMDYLKPKYWIIENPETGLLKRQYFMVGIPFDNVDYCKYGLPYRKRTTLWNNVDNWVPKPLCAKDCGQMIGNRHREAAQRGPTRGHETNRHKQSELYKVPAELIKEIFSSMEW